MLARFSIISDPRIHRSKLHKLVDILVLSFLGSVGGAEGWEDMQDYAEDNGEWLKTFLELPYGLPCHDTFRRVISALDPEALLKAVLEIIGKISPCKLLCSNHRSASSFSENLPQS